MVDATIYLPHQDRNEIAKVMDRKKNANGNFVGRKHRIPSLDSRVYTVQFADGEKKDVSYNMLAEHLYSQVDSEGNQYRVYQDIISHRRKSSAVHKADAFC